MGKLLPIFLKLNTLQHSVHPDAGNEGTFTFIGGAPALSSANPVRGVSPKHSLV